MNQERNRELNALMDGMMGGGASAEPASDPEPASPARAVATRLRKGEPETRLQAAFDLGTIGGAEAVAPLADALDDTDGRVRRTAARALLRISSAVRIPAGPVAAHLAHGDPLVRETAARLLGNLRAEEARDALVEALRKETSPRATAALADALGRIGGAGALRAVARAAERLDGPAKLACLRALGAFGPPAAGPLADALGSPYPDVRETALSVLKELSGEDFGPNAADWRAWGEGAAEGRSGRERPASE
jgi:HEAT repeat protein